MPNQKPKLSVVKPPTPTAAPETAERMSPDDVRKFFGTEVQAEVDPRQEGPAPVQYKASDFKGALLSDERIVIYMTAEQRKGQKIVYWIFNNPLGQRTLVFPDEAVLEVGIEGLVDQETLDRATAMGRMG